MHRGNVTVEVDKQITKNMLKMEGTKVDSVSSWSVEVVGKLSVKHHVLLKDKKCSCRMYDRVGIPCRHALLVTDSFGLPHRSLVADWYKISCWVRIYIGVINP